MAESRRKLREQRDELVAALKAVEWQKQDDGSGSSRCPLCFGQGGVDHYHDCLIGNALAKVKKEAE